MPLISLYRLGPNSAREAASTGHGLDKMTAGKRKYLPIHDSFTRYEVMVVIFKLMIKSEVRNWWATLFIQQDKSQVEGGGVGSFPVICTECNAQADPRKQEL